MKKYFTGLFFFLFNHYLFAQSPKGGLLMIEPPAATIGDQGSGKYIEYKYLSVKAYKYNLPNGVSFIIKGDTSKKYVSFSAVANGGASTFEDADYQSAIHAGVIIGGSGLGDFNPAGFTAFMKEKGITLTPAISENYSTLKGNFTYDELETALQVIYLYFTAPKYDKEYFETYIKDLKAGLAPHSKNADAVFQDTVNAALTGYSSRDTSLDQKKISEISLEKAYAIFKQCFSNPANFTFIFSGDVKPEAMRIQSKTLAMIIQYLGALPRGAVKTAIADRHTDVLPGKIYKKIYNGNGPLADVRLIYSGYYHHSDSVKLQFKVLADLLSEKLHSFADINNAVVKGDLNKYPNQQYIWTIAFKCLPNKTDQFIDTVQRQIHQLQTDLKTDDLQEYLAKCKSEFKVKVSDGQFVADYFFSQSEYKDDFEEIARYPYNFRKATVQSLQQAATEYLSGKNYMQFVLVPKKFR